MLVSDALIATYGEPLLRLSTGVGSQIDRVGTLEVAVGGAELNVAVALTALGRSARYISAVPDSALGDRVITELRSRGVLTDHVQRVPDARMGLYFVEHAGAPRAHRVVYDRAATAFAGAAVDHRALDGVGTLIISGITAALGPGPATQLTQLVKAAGERGIRVVIDVNYRALLWSPAAAKEALAPLLRSADVVVCAARDAHTVFGVGGPPPQRVHALRAQYAPAADLVVLTDSANGAVAASAQGQWSAIAPATTVVDRFGAGDAFTAGLIWSLTAGDDPQRALAAGVALAAMACTVHGDIAAFAESELRSIINDPAAVMVR
jgi:2-dehydro-3-deoxygluconokinase